MLCDPDKVADLVPVDMVINLMLVSAWRIGTTKTKELPIYNCSTGIYQKNRTVALHAFKYGV